MSDPTPTAPPFGAPYTGATPPTVTCLRCGTVASAGSRFCPSCGAPISASGEVAEDQLLVRLRQATQGEYDVLREVGHGGMAAVYLAWDRELARYVAIKVLLPELAHHPTMSQRFLQEARTAANLDDHPSVVRVYRAKEAQGLRYFVMKYVDGCSLEQLLRSAGPLPPDLAAHVVDQVALALQYAHEHGVVHRDVKPGNILLDRAGGVVVTDFGIAKVAEAEQLTRTGFAIGTPHYMSPEQWRVEPLTPASDQYALGVVAYHLVTGEVPFDGTQYAIQEQHLRAEPPVLSARRDGVPAAFGAVVRVMLAKAPTERFPDLRSVSQALSAIPRDSAPVLRERLSRLIPAANTPGVREVPPPDVAVPHPDVAIDRRVNTPPIADAPVAAARVAEPALPSKVTPTTFVPRVSAPPGSPSPVSGSPVSGSPVSAPPLGAPPVGAARVGAPRVGGAPGVGAPLGDARATPAAVEAPPPSPPVEHTAPSLNPTTTFRTVPPIDAMRAVPATPAPVAAGGGVADDGEALRAPAVLEGPITRQDTGRPVWPWLAAAVGAAIVIGGGIAALRRPATDPTPGTTATASTRAGEPAGATTPANTTPRPGPDSAGPNATQDTGPADVSGVPTPTNVPQSEAEVDAPPGPVPAGPPGAPAALLVVGAPSGGTVAVGDSVRLRARVNDAHGTRLVKATVQWASSDPSHVAFRNGWAVGVAPSTSPVAVTATSGALVRTVRLAVTPRVGAALRAPIARPTATELRTEVQRFIALLDGHDFAEVSRRLAARALDGSSSHEFVTWLEATQGLTTDAPVLGDESDEGGRGTVSFRVPLRWRSGGGATGERGRKDVNFWMRLSHDEQGWHGGEVLLGGRVGQ